MTWQPAPPFQFPSRNQPVIKAGGGAFCRRRPAKARIIPPIKEKRGPDVELIRAPPKPHTRIGETRIKATARTVPSSSLQEPKRSTAGSVALIPMATLAQRGANALMTKYSRLHPAAFPVR